ncbi:FAD-dependent oxidoreductase [Streptomyces sp. NPDC001941]|uniref:NAD(P)/FAD-dependent oxidoreductase n=1 Tax=Streptomyces sp. NPDC001941 TaxID=3154659 RepID=UPI0033295D94
MRRDVDVLVVGAGPAGLALAARLAAAGAGAVEVLEREEEPGGTPRHCHRGGFGLGARGRTVDGPLFARHWAAAARGAGARLRTSVTATGWAGPRVLEVTGPQGLERIGARAVVLATGARERPRAARLVPGTRPAGVYTTGELQRTVAAGLRVGTRAVVVGAGSLAGHAVRLLRRAGVRVAALVTPGPAPRAVGAQVVRGGVGELLGRGRLSGVVVHASGGAPRAWTVRCDTVVFTGDWIPEHELARGGGLRVDPVTRGPVVDAAFATSEPGVFAVGTLLRGGVRAAAVAREGEAAAVAVLRHLARP